MNTFIFVVLLATSFTFFARTMWLFGRAVATGAPDPRPRIDQLPERLASVLIYFFAQKKVAEEGPQHRTSKHHLFIFWGFLLITIGTADLLVSGVVPALAMKRWMPGLLFIPLTTLIDVFNLIVLTMVTWAVLRRTLVRPRLIPWNLDAGLILGAIGSLMLTHFLYHGYHIAGDLSIGVAAPEGMPISNAVARWLEPVSAGVADRGAAIGYWLHILILLTFLNYLPYSKHIHLLGALPNIFTRNLSTRTMDLPKLNLEDETQWGVGRYEQFSWKSLLDTYACTECARCSNYCPAYNTGKNLSPMQLIHDIRYEMLDRVALRDAIADAKQSVAGLSEYAARSGLAEPGHEHPDLVSARAELAALEQREAAMPRMTGGRVAEDTLWACTTCGACQEVCPVFIEHPMKIIQMRQNLVLEQEKVPGELARAFKNIERQSNPWGIANDKRMDWAEGLDVPTIEEHPDPEYLLWVGCAGAFDARIVKQTRAMVRVLREAKVDFAVLGHQEGCTGDPARRAGNEMLFQMLAEQNVETMKSANVKKVVTSCPHCLHTLRHDYPQFGGDFEVIHHTQLISHLIDTQKLTVGGSPVDTVTYHDSCYLGRWNKEFDAPRDVLEALKPAGGVTELVRSKRHGFCCGAGGGRMFMEEHEGERVNQNRTDEILATEVDAVAVACPFCNIMITDGVKQRNKDEQVKVLDIAELVAQSFDVPASALARKKKPADAS
ncbi:MAG: 4Fe-4S dicluster domain-containing protein [Deltaproteobacteria bacterium]|nr:4Fe-4S dicluster domain-containing protein [Kofleriaceae bacterium]